MASRRDLLGCIQQRMARRTSFPLLCESANTLQSVSSCSPARRRARDGAPPHPRRRRRRVPDRVDHPAHPDHPSSSVPDAPHRRSSPMNPAAPHRAGLTVLVGLAAALVVAGLVAGSPMIEQFMPRLPAMPGPQIGFAFAAISLIALAVWAIVRLGRIARTRAR